MQHSKASGKIRGGTTRSTVKPRTSGEKAVNHRWQRAPASEICQKKRASRVPELEFQLTRLQEELKNTKAELHQAESRTKQAYLEAELAKKQLTALSAELKESQNQLKELSACEDSRIHELRKISQERDRVWESELKSVQRHLSTAVIENQKLNIRLQRLTESEAIHAERAESTQLELLETVDVVEELKIQLNESKDSESRALEVEKQLEMMKVIKEKDENGEGELAAAMAATAEVEGELRRLKVQTDQWRKAAEVAAAMVLGNRGGGCDGDDGFEDESSMKKTSNLLKKIGVLLKKGQK